DQSFWISPRTTRRRAAGGTMSDLEPGEQTWIDRVADQFERDWGSGGAPRIEDYIADAKESRRPGLFQELVRVEREILTKRGAAGRGIPPSLPHVRRADHRRLRPGGAPAVQRRPPRCATDPTGAGGCHGTPGRPRGSPADRFLREIRPGRIDPPGRALGGAFG